MKTSSWMVSPAMSMVLPTSFQTTLQRGRTTTGMEALVRGTAVKDGKAYTVYVTRFLWDEDGIGIAGLLIRTEDTSELVEIYV